MTGRVNGRKAGRVWRYVVGFVFDLDAEFVVLICKRRPRWQAGYFNGLGGEVRSGERPVDAMIRECAEESGLDIPIHFWGQVCRLAAPQAAVEVYRAFHKDAQAAHTTTDEPVSVFRVDELPLASLPNVRWLVPMCLDPNVPFPGPVVEIAPAHQMRLETRVARHG